MSRAAAVRPMSAPVILVPLRIQYVARASREGGTARCAGGERERHREPRGWMWGVGAIYLRRRSGSAAAMLASTRAPRSSQRSCSTRRREHAKCHRERPCDNILYLQVGCNAQDRKKKSEPRRLLRSGRGERRVHHEAPRPTLPEHVKYETRSSRWPQPFFAAQRRTHLNWDAKNDGLFFNVAAASWARHARADESLSNSGLIRPP